MKKIMVILISLLFIVSTWGVAAATQETDSSSIDCCNPMNFNISKTSVKVGETFVVYYYKSWAGGCYTYNVNAQDGLVEKILINVYRNGKLAETYDLRKGDIFPGFAGESYIEDVYIALKPGKAFFNTANCGETQVTISSRALPMDKFMKIFGFGKEK
jgi:hypothetical protein